MLRAENLFGPTLLSCAVVLIGCGGGAEPPAAIQAAKKANVAPAPAPPAPPPRQQNPAAAPAVATPAKTVAPLSASADPNDVFEVVPPNDTFVIVPPLGDASEGEMVEITPLPEGLTESTFVLGAQTSPGEGKQRPDLVVPPGYRVLPDFGFSAEGYPNRIVCDIDKSVMVLVPAGNFRQGTDDGADDARPAHSVYLDAFYIDVAEVTVAQYLAFRSTLSATDKRVAKAPLNENDPGLMPVHGVRFSDAVAYAKWCGKELPTEAEWEKAARGAEGETPWGKGRALFSRRRARTDIAPIMSFPQDVSPYGVWDMGGNVREWCTDWYEPDAYQAAFDRGETFENWTGPREPGPDFLRVAKGSGPDWAVWHREGLNSAEQVPGIGFRCVLRGKGGARRVGR